MSTAGPASIRLDKWLWQARFCKSRGLAARLIADVDDGLSFALAGRVRTVRILALGSRRGPATEARTLYADLDDPAARATLEPDPEAGK